MLHSIRSRIFLVALLPVLVIMPLVGLLLIQRHAHEIERVVVERAISLSRQAAMLAELPLAAGSSASVRAAADTIERGEAVLGIALFDRNQVALDSRGNVGGAALRMLDSKPVSVQVDQSANLVAVVHPVMLLAQPAGGGIGGKGVDAAQRVGYVALSVSRADEQRTIARLWWTGGAILATGVAVALMLARLLTRGIARPLSQLSAGMARVAHDDYAAALPETGQGELRTLATHFNRMSRALSHARSGLRDEVKRATDALAERTREAESANSAKSRFLAAASHDLRQPAHALSLYVAALRQALKRQPTAVGDSLLPAVDGMQAASRSLDALLNAVLDISRFDARVVDVNVKPLMLANLLAEAATVQQTAARERGLAVRVRCPQVAIETDATLLRRIVDNLTANAIKFSRSGQVLVAVRPRRDHCLLQVWDQGVGIAEANLPLIFEEFYQVKRGDLSPGGMGLGLAIVARCVVLLGGEIHVRSVVGRGTCFTVRLPGAPRRVSSAAAVANVVTPGGDHPVRTVLVLDDDPLIRDSMHSLFTGHGHNVVAEATASALLPAAVSRGAGVAAAFVDYRLGDGFSGITAARRLRDVLGPGVPVVLITGDTSPERLRDLQGSGFQVLHKPLSPAAMLAVLDAPLSREQRA